MIRRLAVLIATAALAACADQRDTPEPRPTNPLANTRWVHAEGGYDAATIEFDVVRASGHTGCNRWFGHVAADGEEVAFSAVGVTRRACEPALMQVEREFLADLSAARIVRVEDGQLVLRNAAGAELDRFERRR